MFTQEIKRKKVKFNDFIKLPPVHCQRDEQFRMRPIAKLFRNEFQPTGLEIAVAVYPSGKIVILNGNTRKEMWKLEENADIRPEWVYLTYYHVKDDDEAKQLYLTFDSDKAVEKTTHKIQGAYRTNGMKFNTPKLQKASGLVKPLQYAAVNNPDITSPQNLGEVVPYFKEALYKLDEIGKCHKLDVTQFCAVIMMLTLYGTENTRLNKGIDNLINGYSEGNSKTGEDGIGFIIREWHTHNYLGDKGTDGKRLPQQLDFVLWCFEKWMNKEKITRFRGPSIVIGKQGCRLSVYDTFWNYKGDSDS